MYTLTLTREERKAIDWVGHRYSHGADLRSLLTAYEGVDACEATDEWDSMGDVTYTLPEHTAWHAVHLIAEDDLACFSAELCRKLQAFSDTVV